jgi:hypothetical protein
MKKHSSLWQRALVAASVLAVTAFVDVDSNGIELGPRTAHAIVGRPLTPVSYAGAARRTVRRTTAVAAGASAAAVGTAAVVGSAAVATAAAVRVATLPAGCVAAGGIYRCGAVSYRAVFDGPNVVYVQM